MTQNKALYTRRFNQLKKQLLAHFGDSVDASDTAVLRWSSEACIIAHDGSLGFELCFRGDGEEALNQYVQIVKTPTCYKGGLIGIHVRETNLCHLLDQIETALKDGFESIYIESIESLKAS